MDDTGNYDISEIMTLPNNSLFSIQKSLQVLQKACIKIVAHAIYTYKIFFYIHSLLLLKNKMLL